MTHKAVSCLEVASIVKISRATPTLEARLELFVHHAVHDALDVAGVRVACAIVHCRFVDDVVCGVASLRKERHEGKGPEAGSFRFVEEHMGGVRNACRPLVTHLQYVQGPSHVTFTELEQGLLAVVRQFDVFLRDDGLQAPLDLDDGKGSKSEQTQTAGADGRRKRTTSQDRKLARC